MRPQLSDLSFSCHKNVSMTPYNASVITLSVPDLAESIHQIWMYIKEIPLFPKFRAAVPVLYVVIEFS